MMLFFFVFHAAPTLSGHEPWHLQPLKAGARTEGLCTAQPCRKYSCVSYRKQHYSCLAWHNVDKKYCIKLHLNTHISCGTDNPQCRVSLWPPSTEGWPGSKGVAGIHEKSTGAISFKAITAAWCPSGTAQSNRVFKNQPGGFILKAAVCHPSHSLPAQGKMKCLSCHRKYLCFPAVSVGLSEDILKSLHQGFLNCWDKLQATANSTLLRGPQTRKAENSQVTTWWLLHSSPSRAQCWSCCRLSPLRCCPRRGSQAPKHWGNTYSSH